MSNLVSSLIFCCRNTEKAENGDVGRAAVAVGQATKIGKAVANYHNTVSKGSTSAVTIFNELAEKNKLVKYSGNALDWASKNVNPLICASGVLKTAMSEDKLETGLTEAAALSTMFFGENMMKLHLDDLMETQGVKEAIKNLEKVKWTKPMMEKLAKWNCGSKLSAVIKGILFVGGSITSYEIGHIIGKDLTKDFKSSLGLQNGKINQMA